MNEKMSIVPLLIAAIGGLVTAIVILWKYIGKKDRHIIGMTEKVTEAMTKGHQTIENNTATAQRTGDQIVKAVDGLTNIYNELHKDILRATKK